MQTDPLTPSHAHPHLQALKAIQPVHAVSSGQPALATQQDVNALISKPRGVCGRARVFVPASGLFFEHLLQIVSI